MTLSKIDQIHCDCQTLFKQTKSTIMYSYIKSISSLMFFRLQIIEQMSSFRENALQRLFKYLLEHCETEVHSISYKNGQVLTALTDYVDRFRRSVSYFENSESMKSMLWDSYAKGRCRYLEKQIDEFLTTMQMRHTSVSNVQAENTVQFISSLMTFTVEIVSDERSIAEALLGIVPDSLLGAISDCLSAPTGDFVDNCVSITAASSNVNIINQANSLIAAGTLVGIGVRRLSPIRALGLLLPKSPEPKLIAILSQSQTLIKSAVSQCAHRIGRGVDVDPTTLNSLDRCLHSVLEIIGPGDSHAETSLVLHEDITELFVQGVTDVILQGVMLAGSRMQSVDASTFMLNALLACRRALMPYCSQDLAEKLEAQISAQRESMVTEQAVYIINATELSSLYDVEKLRSETETSSLIRFRTFLENPEYLMMPQISALTSPVLRETIKKQSLNIIMDEYRRAHSAMDRLDSINVEFIDPEEVQRMLFSSSEHQLS
ncbi:hypothetical protein ACOME3_003789 [Neoechinorhynchus agilis]